MSTEKGYTRINELVAALNGALLDMEQGRLGAQGLERTTEDARELYERLVVLRHKVREARAAMSAKAGAEKVVPLPVVAEVVPEPTVKTEAPERPTMRLDTRPDVSPRQTSLIDAIAEHEEPAAPKKPIVAATALGSEGALEPKAEELAVVASEPEPKPVEVTDAAPKIDVAKPASVPPAKRGPSLADKMEHAPIADLGKAISLSQKFLFLAELFGGQSAVYEKAIDTINGYKAFEEAKQYLDTEVIAKLKRSPDPEALSSFMDLVERRFK